MTGGHTLVQAAQRAWSDPEIRARIVAMHAENLTLEEMVDELGLGPAMDADGLRDIVRDLPGDAVDAIRGVFVAEAVAAIGSGAFFPVDCRIGQLGDPVQVIETAGLEGAGSYVRIDPA
jgi:hypothetical protein